MTEYKFQLERVTLQDMRVLIGLASVKSDLVFPYVCSLLEKAGIDLDDMPVTEFHALFAVFLEQVSAFLSKDFGEYPQFDF